MKSPEACFQCLKDRAKANIHQLYPRMGKPWVNNATNAISDCTTERELRQVYASLNLQCRLKPGNVFLSALPAKYEQPALI